MIKIHIMLFIMFLVFALFAIGIIYELLEIEYNMEVISSIMITLYIIFEILRYWHNKENPNQEI